MARSLRTVAQFAGQTPFTEPQLRWWIFNAATNGMRQHRVIVRIGRRIYLDPEAFDRWLDAQNTREAAA